MKGEMWMIPKPVHIDGYVKKLPNKSKYVEYDFDEYTLVYEVECSCGCNEFNVFLNAEPRVEVECTNCSNRIIVYDLDYYTCAEKYKEEELQRYTSLEGDESFNVCVIYEYSDEFSFNHKSFDCNDVTWCNVYLYGIKSENSIKIVDDETA